MQQLVELEDLKWLILDKERAQYSLYLEKELVNIIDNRSQSRMEYIRTALVNFILFYFEMQTMQGEEILIENQPKKMETEMKVSVQFKRKEMDLIERFTKFYGFNLRSQFLRYLIRNSLKAKGLL